MILVVMLTSVSELPCLSDARSRGLADDSGRPEFVPLLAAYLSGRGSIIDGNALSCWATQVVF
jgi:hypothetical protein